MMSDLPIESVLPELCRILSDGGSAVLTAPPGAGKTTRVPLALLDADWLERKKLIILEPRRLATRAAAHRMASTLGEIVGQRVGYRMRLDTKVSAQTRIEVVTEGILPRLLQSDPSLSEYGLVIFDEFHERSLHADLSLALCLEAHRLFRPDLRLLVMSATLDYESVAKMLGDVPTLSCEGRMFPVETHYLERPDARKLNDAVVQTIHHALTKDSGSLLVFLPGMAEIRRVERRLKDSQLPPDVFIAPLHGDLPQTAQDLAIAPAPSGHRKIVLATAIAETSLTIEGVRVVIDSGLMRIPRFDPRSSLTRLETVQVTRDSADQRRGRAGRLEPGVCYRLWTTTDHRTLLPRRTPEMLEADLSSLMLELAVWGTVDPSELTWLDSPPAGATAQARNLLVQLGATNDDGGITPHGRQMADFALHPRLAHMLLTSLAHGLGPVACEIAALLSEQDMLRRSPGFRQSDLQVRFDVLHGNHDHLGKAAIDRSACQRVRKTALQWRERLGLSPSLRVEPSPAVYRSLGMLLALAYPDRVAQRQPGDHPRYLLANGRGAQFTQADPLSSEVYLVIADLDGGTPWANIHLAAPIALEDMKTCCANLIHEHTRVSWDERQHKVLARRQRCLGQLVLEDQAIRNPDPALILSALLQGVREKGLDCLRWTPELRQWQARVEFLRRIDKASSQWPDVSNASLLARMGDWLGPFLDGLTRLDQVERIDLTGPLQAHLTWNQKQQLDRLAPTHLTVPSGSRIRVNYESPDIPVLAVRLQEMFGCLETPRVADGRIPVMLHLLSPARRPVQVTQHLSSFWATAYHDVKKDLRGRYPKHHWPDDPFQAAPTRNTKTKF